MTINFRNNKRKIFRCLCFTLFICVCHLCQIKESSRIIHVLRLRTNKLFFIFYYFHMKQFCEFSFSFGPDCWWQRKANAILFRKIKLYRRRNNTKTAKRERNRERSGKLKNNMSELWSRVAHIAWWERKKLQALRTHKLWCYEFILMRGSFRSKDIIINANIFFSLLTSSKHWRRFMTWRHSAGSSGRVIDF